jgi:hypothetical protein
VPRRAEHRHRDPHGSYPGALAGSNDDRRLTLVAPDQQQGPVGSVLDACVLVQQALVREDQSAVVTPTDPLRLLSQQCARARVCARQDTQLEHAVALHIYQLKRILVF